jgi:hypothetical protein
MPYSLGRVIVGEGFHVLLTPPVVRILGEDPTESRLTLSQARA